MIISGVGFVLLLEAGRDAPQVQYFSSQSIKIWVNATDPRGIAWGAASVRNTFDHSVTIDGILVDNVNIPLDNWYVERNQTVVFDNGYGYGSNFFSFFNYTANDMHGMLKGTILTGGKTSGTCKVSTGNVIEIDEDGIGSNPPLCLQKENKSITFEEGDGFIIYFRLPNGLLKPVDAGNTAIVTIHADRGETTTNVTISNPSGRFDVFEHPVPVGSMELTGIAYDSAKGEMFVTGGGYDTVYVISDTTNAVVSTIPVGRTYGIAYDSAKGEMFVTGGYGSDTVFVISDATNTVVDEMHVGINTLGIAYDSAKGEMFVTGGSVSDGTVSVISDATNAIVATIPAGNNTLGIAYDSAKGEMFVTGYGTVSMISDGTSSIPTVVLRILP